MPCWLFMARFHIHLSAPSQQIGLRIYAFLRQWCYQSGKLPLDGRRDNKRGVRLDQYHSTRLCSANSIKVLPRLKRLSQMARRHGLVKKFCRFNFVSISWKRNLDAHCLDILGFSETALHYVYALLLPAWMSSFLFFHVWSFLFVCFLFTAARRT